MKLFSWFGFRQIRNQLLAPCLMFNKAEKIFVLNTKKMIKTLVCVIVPFWGLKSSNQRALIQFNNFSLFKLFLKMWNDMCSEHQLSLTYESFVRISRRHFFHQKIGDWIATKKRDITITCINAWFILIRSVIRYYHKDEPTIPLLFSFQRIWIT